MDQPFLYLNNWHARQPVTRFDRHLAASGMRIETYRTNLNEFPGHTRFCGAYVSPSFNGAYDDLDWVHRLHDLLPRLADRSIPMIGLCFGCQVLASALVARDAVFQRASHEGGRGTISMTREAQNHDHLCTALPAEFDVYHWHGDEVRDDMPEIEVLASGSGCGNHLWRWSRGLVWGVQPHLEMAGEDLETWLEQNRPAFEVKGHDVDAYVSQCFTSDQGFAVLERFVALVRAKQAGCEHRPDHAGGSIPTHGSPGFRR